MMKTIKKVSAFILMVALCMSVMVKPAFAASTSQDGLEVTLTTDKDTYEKGDQITATLVVKNTNDFAISNVSLENMIPDGYKLADGSTTTKQVESLDAGESVTLTVTYVAEDANDNEDNPGGGDDSGEIDKPGSGDSTGDIDKPGSDNDTDNGNNSENNANNANTGDDSHILFWSGIAVVALGMGTIILMKKKQGKRFLSLFLCFAMLGTMFSSSLVPVKADELQKRSVSIAETVMIDDTELTLRAVVNYEVEDESLEDVGEISFREPTDEHVVLDESTGYYYVDNEILITGNENVTRQEIEQIINDIGGKVVGCIEITNDYQVELQKPMTVPELNELVEQLNNNDTIEEATIHYLYEMDFDSIPDDAKWKSEEWSSDYPEGSNWGVEAINAMGAWEHCDEMDYVKVGVIDGMFDTHHEDIAFTKVWNNPQDISSESAELKTYHGTHVSGTIAACFNNGKGIAGVAPKVVLYGYSILGSETDSVVRTKTLVGYMECKYALARLITANCKVINVSMGNKEPDFKSTEAGGRLYGNFLKKLLDNGYDFVVVQAAGNDSTYTGGNGGFVGVTQPDVKDRIIIVGSAGNNGSHKDGFLGMFGDRVFDGYHYSDISNFGERVDVVAPGENIYSTVPDNGYGNKSGTSMATPHVTGIAAMCFSVNPSLTGKQVKEIIKNTATTTVYDNNKDHLHRNYQFVDANAAVELALHTHGEAISPVNPANGFVMGIVFGIDEGPYVNFLNDVKITAYRISDYEGNLSEYASSSHSDKYGYYELILEPGKYYINIYKEGYLPFAFCDVNVKNDQITYMDDVKLIPDTEAEKINQINGTVRNALTGASIEGVTVRLRPGWDNKTGKLATAENGTDAVTVTDSNGKYSIKVLGGSYTAELIKDGYITGYANVICTDAYYEVEQDAVLTPILSENEYRVVLTWSSTPNDLDSHISGPMSNGNRFHVYYGENNAYENGEMTAKLDLDDTTSYGPETITLKRMHDGVYKYAVHDFTNRESSSSKALSMSGAKVELYCGNELIETYHVPIDVTGTVWNVFEIEGDTVRTINTMENKKNPSDVCRVADDNTSIFEETTSSEDEIKKDSKE